MRTKTLLFTAVLGAAGILTSMAQTNVYSVNVVGYVNVTVTNGQFAMIANPLQSTNNTLGALISNVPDGTQAYRWNGTGYAIYLFEQIDPNTPGEWSPNGSASLAPGEGIFLRNNASTNLTITFVGEVLQGTLTTPLPAGYEIRSSKVPQAGRVTTDLAMPARDGDQLFKWNSATGGYLTYLFEQAAPGTPGDWSPSEPVINVGESFFVRKNAAENWTRTFTVPQ